MSWKVYALVSGGAFLATYGLSGSPVTTLHTEPMSPEARTSQTLAVGLVDLADRLSARVAAQASFRAPTRDPFDFVATVTPGDELTEPVQAVESPASAFTPPPRPPFALAGIASDTVDGVARRTAILASLQGVQLVREGDTVSPGYRVVAVEEDAITVESSGDLARTTLRLSGSTGNAPAGAPRP